MDLHGLPGAQTPENPFTGQYASEAGFYEDYQYERALKFLEWMTTNIHQNDKFRNVGMLEIVNEPEQEEDKAASVRAGYYPNAFRRIRATEQKLSVDQNDYLHIQMMDETWGAGDPNQYLDDLYYAAYDDHRYLKWANVDTSHDSYISTSCSDEPGSNTPLIVGEWSLAVADDIESDSDWDPDSNTDFYKKWFTAQITAYEKQQGWVFWTWKAQLGDYRWSYQDAVSAGVIPTDLNSALNMGACG